MSSHNNNNNNNINNNNDVRENEMDLGLGLGINNQYMEPLSLWDDDPGNGRAIAFAPSSPLKELVWSPRHGFTLKRADLRPYDVGPSQNPSHSVTCEASDYGKPVIEETSVVSPHKDNLEASNKGKEKEINLGGQKGAVVYWGEGSKTRRTCDRIPRFVEKAFSSAPKRESTAENDAATCKSVAKGGVSPCKLDGNGSMESCNSGNVLSKRDRRRPSLDQPLGMESKRNKIQESSFMNWIANMVKGLRPLNQPQPVDEPFDQRVYKTEGFKTVFQSLSDKQTHTEKSSSKEFPLVGHLKHGLHTFHHEKISISPKTPPVSSTLHHSDSDEIPKQRSSNFEPPKDLFDLIRRLRLSRTDILKWRSCGSPIASLEGFFLRLRISKREERLGESDYHVAFIIGPIAEKKRSSIDVNIEGVKCLAETRYVSNRDFLEEELVSWWRKMSTTGQIPSEEAMNSKLEQRKMLGL